ncbi:hypothetical protein [Nannocystis pusilla]|uniref:hypothetical protein n=1 Tax=Nannocystis pusilla TaxID=889268 RepID=UPI003B805D67
MGGARAQLDGFGAIWGCFGGTTLVLWLLICRIGLIWPKSQPFRWSGAAAFALSVSPAVAGLAIPELREFGKAGIFVWLFGSGLGVTPVLTLAVMIWEARRVGRHAERAIAAGEDPARRG